MRRRLLAALVFGLASVTFWAAAIPFASESPVAIAYSVEQGPGNANIAVVASPQWTFTDAVFQQAQDDLASMRFDWRHSSAPTLEPTPEPTQATPVPLSSPAPQDEPTATDRKSVV
jgi:hypothetical protein